MKVYTVKEMAEVLNLTPLTVAEYIREGKLKAFKVGKQWRMTESDLMEFIKKARED